jgi:hypothetical protein
MWFCKWKFVVIMPPGRKAQTVGGNYAELKPTEN